MVKRAIGAAVDYAFEVEASRDHYMMMSARATEVVEYMQAEYDRLRDALEWLTTECERSKKPRTVMGTAHNRYDFSWEVGANDPVIAAREVLKGDSDDPI